VIHMIVCSGCTVKYACYSNTVTDYPVCQYVECGNIIKIHIYTRATLTRSVSVVTGFWE